MSLTLRILRAAEQHLRRRRVAWLKTRVSVSPSPFHKIRRRFQAYLRLNLIRQKLRQRLELDRLVEDLRVSIREGRELRDRLTRRNTRGSTGSSSLES
mgnify:CR=1 FL=1